MQAGNKCCFIKIVRNMLHENFVHACMYVNVHTLACSVVHIVSLVHLMAKDFRPPQFLSSIHCKFCVHWAMPDSLPLQPKREIFRKVLCGPYYNCPETLQTNEPRLSAHHSGFFFTPISTSHTRGICLGGDPRHSVDDYSSKTVKQVIGCSEEGDIISCVCMYICM